MSLSPQRPNSFPPAVGIPLTLKQVVSLRYYNGIFDSLMRTLPWILLLAGWKLLDSVYSKWLSDSHLYFYSENTPIRFTLDFRGLSAPDTCDPSTESSV